MLSVQDSATIEEAALISQSDYLMYNEIPSNFLHGELIVFLKKCCVLIFNPFFGSAYASDTTSQVSMSSEVHSLGEGSDIGIFPDENISSGEYLVFVLCILIQTIF